MKRHTLLKLSALFMGFLYPSAAFADGIDLVAYFSRTPFGSVAVAIPVAGVLMLVNYALNFVVIGLPALHMGKVHGGPIARSLIWLTLLGQVADRIGAVMAALLVDPVTDALGLTGEGAWVAPPSSA